MYVSLYKLHCINFSEKTKFWIKGLLKARRLSQ